MKFSSVSIEAPCRKVQEYDNNWERVTEIKIMKKQLIISHSVGALFMDLESHSVSQILSVQYKPKSLVTYKDLLLFTTSQKSVYFWKSPSIDVFAGKEEEISAGMVRFPTAAFMKLQESRLSLITLSMSVIEVLVQCRS